MAFQIKTVSGSSLTGEIKKANSEEVFFVDVRCPEYLIIVKFDYIDSIYKGNDNITLTIINNGIKGKINYNSFLKVITYDDNTNIDLYVKEEKSESKNPLPFINLLLKTSAGAGKMIRKFNGKTFEYSSNVYFSVSSEIIIKFKKRYHIGAGFIYQTACKTSWGISDYYHHNNNKTFHNLPIYVLIRSDILNHKDKFNSYVFTNLGYNRIWGYIFPDDYKLKAGLFAGIGMGVQLNNIIFEVTFKHFGSSYIDDDGDTEHKLNFEALTISIGYSTK